MSNCLAACQIPGWRDRIKSAATSHTRMFLITSLVPASMFSGFFTQDCQLCGIRADASLCNPCRRDLPIAVAITCPRCAGHSPAGLECGACIAEPPAFDQTLAAFKYRFPLDRLVQSYKFNENLALVTLFSEAMLETIRRHADANSQVLPERIVALPLARKRLATRGFNQSAVLAERLAAKLGLPYAPHGLLKIRDTPPQAGLGREARRKNVRGAFDCGESLTGQHVALVDDVMTTGATLSEAAAALKKAGARFVSAWVVARAELLETNSVAVDTDATA